MYGLITVIQLATNRTLFLNNCLACAGLIGSSGLFSVSKTNTLDIIFCSEEPPISGVMLALTMLEVGNYLKSTGLTLKPV